MKIIRRLASLGLNGVIALYAGRIFARASNGGLTEVLARLDPLGPEEQLPDVDETILPVNEVDFQ